MFNWLKRFFVKNSDTTEAESSLPKVDIADVKSIALNNISGFKKKYFPKVQSISDSILDDIKKKIISKSTLGLTKMNYRFDLSDLEGLLAQEILCNILKILRESNLHVCYLWMDKGHPVYQISWE